MNICRLLIEKISKLIHSNKKTWFGDFCSTFYFATFSQITKKDTLDLVANKCLFCFSRSTIQQKQKWGFYARVHQWRAILWRL